MADAVVASGETLSETGVRPATVVAREKNGIETVVGFATAVVEPS